MTAKITANYLPEGLTFSADESVVSEDQTSLTVTAGLTVPSFDTAGTLAPFNLTFTVGSNLTDTVCNITVNIHICDHEYTSECDTFCDVCLYERTVTEAHDDTDKDGKCNICNEYAIGDSLAGYSLSLEGNIGVNFYMELEENIIADTEAEGITISYSPLSYAYKALSSDTTSDSLKNLVKALYLYHLAICDYAGYA